MLRGADGHAHSTSLTDHWQLWPHYPTSTQINAASIPLNSPPFCCSSAQRRHTSRSPVPAQSWQNPECDPAGRTRITFLTWAQVLEPDTWARLISKEWNACDMRAHILNEVTPLGLTMLSPRTYTIWQKSKNEKLPSEWLVLRETPKATKVAAFTFAYLPEVEGKSRMLKMLQIWLRWRTRQVWAGFELKA